MFCQLTQMSGGIDGILDESFSGISALFDDIPADGFNDFNGVNCNIKVAKINS